MARQPNADVDRSIEAVSAAVAELAASWAADRPSRQGRRHLDPADFHAIAASGFLRTVVPVEHGGLWAGTATSARLVIELLRTLGQGDPSVALVAAMHPAVISFWLMSETASTEPSPGSAAAWTAQRAAVFATAMAGHQWGTITSEPGSGGDIARTRSVAVVVDDSDAGATTELAGAAYRISGDKHFGSGSGISSFMITTAVPDGGPNHNPDSDPGNDPENDPEPALFVLDVRDRPWGHEGEADRQTHRPSDGTMTLVAEWDGRGMAATQSHAMRLDHMVATRCAWPGPLPELAMAAGPFNACVFTGVVLGVLDSAVEAARARLAGRSDDLRPFEQTEWVRAEMDHWLAVQAYEGGIRALESGLPTVAAHGALRAKQSVAHLAEDTMARLTRVLGGGTFSERSPFAHWYEDVRALGFLRPPWPLAYDNLYATSFTPE